MTSRTLLHTCITSSYLRFALYVPMLVLAMLISVQLRGSDDYNLYTNAVNQLYTDCFSGIYNTNDLEYAVGNWVEERWTTFCLFDLSTSYPHSLAYIDCSYGTSIKVVNVEREESNKLFPELNSDCSNLDTATYGSYTSCNCSDGFFEFYDAKEFGFEQLSQYSLWQSTIDQSACSHKGAFVSVLMPFITTKTLYNASKSNPQAVSYQEVADDAAERVSPCVSYYLGGRAAHRETYCQQMQSNLETIDPGLTGASNWRIEMMRTGFIDQHTRFVIIDTQFRSMNMGLLACLHIVLEVDSSGTVLPHLEWAAAPDSGHDKWDQLRPLSRAMLAVCCLSLFLETINLISDLHDGSFVYTIWWAINIVVPIVYFLACSQIWTANNLLNLDEDRKDEMDILIYKETGFFPMSSILVTYRAAIIFVALDDCLLIIKCIEYFMEFFPSTSLAEKVLANALHDLAIFAGVFIFFLFAFSFSFYMMWGGGSEDYQSIFQAFITCLRALFGDFDVSNLSSEYGKWSAIYFLVFLFTCVFILLSMFLAILGEAQSNVGVMDRGVDGCVVKAIKLCIRKLHHRARITKVSDADCGEPKGVVDGQQNPKVVDPSQREAKPNEAEALEPMLRMLVKAHAEAREASEMRTAALEAKIEAMLDEQQQMRCLLADLKPGLALPTRTRVEVVEAEGFDLG